MPFSNAEQISPIIAEVRRLRPKSLLDVGCGLGLYGFLCRIYLDLYDDEEFTKKLDAQNANKWEIKIDAIEGFGDYVKFIPQWVYDEIKIGKAQDVVKTIQEDSYDLILFLAILEHMTKEEGPISRNRLHRHPLSRRLTFDPEHCPYFLDLDRCIA